MMTTEVRVLGAGDIEAQIHLSAYAYADLPERIRDWMVATDEAGETRLGVFAGGNLAATLVDRRFTVNVNGAFVPANGIGAVASAAQMRRQGLVRELIGHHLRQLRDDGVVLSLLYPFKFSFYNRFGWGFGERRLQVQVPPKEFALFGEQIGHVLEILYAEKGLIRPAEGYTVDSVIDILNPLYEMEASRWGLAAQRSRDDWRRQLKAWRGRRYVFVWQTASGEPQGYFLANCPEEGYLSPIRCREIVATTPAAWRGLFFFLSCHDSQTKHIQMELPFEHTLLELLGDPRSACKLEHGPMVRAVDVAGLLAARGQDGVGRGGCMLAVHDELAPWNTGRYQVTGGGSDGLAVSQVDDDADGAADLHMAIDAFSQLAVGSRTVDDLLAIGRATGRAGAGLEYARGLFAPRRLWHSEYY